MRDRLPLLLPVLLLLGCAAPAYVAGRRVAPPAVPEVAHAEARIDGVKGASLFVQSWRPPSGEVRGAVIVVHGLKDYGDRYGELARALAGRGFAVHAMDLRGHGDSSGDRVWVDTFDDYLDDLALFEKHVRAAEPGKPLFLFGHSMGGAVVTLYTLERKPDLRGLILSGAALKIAAGGLVRGTTRVFSAIAPTLAVFSLDDSKFSRDPAAAAAMKNDPLISDGAAPARTASEVITAVERIREKSAELTCPVLAMHGTADEVTPPEGSRELIEAAKSTDKTFLPFPGLYHDLLHEPERQQVIDAVTAWLESHAP